MQLYKTFAWNIILEFSSNRILDLLNWLHYCTEALVVASKEIGLEINADKTKYTVMSGD